MRTTAILVASIAGVAIVCSPAKAQLKQTQFPDGTGSIGLAAGWRINGAYDGAVQCVGPNGAAMVMKMPWTIMRPESSVSTLPAAQQQPMASPNNMGEALRQVLTKKVGARLRMVRAKRLADVSPGSPSYMLFYEYEQEGKVYSAIGYFAALDYGPSQPFWQLYSSAIVAPKAQFAKMAPTMMQMWKSWRPNGQPPREGSSSAIFDRIMKDHKASYDRIQQEFREQL